MRVLQRPRPQQCSIAAASWWPLALAVLLAGLFPTIAAGQTPDNSAARAVVQIEAVVPPDARTARSLGTTRQGSGVVIDNSGLIVTIGYLILEAVEVTVTGGDDVVPATIVAYDHETGFGLLRANNPLDVPPVGLGSSAELSPMEPLLVVSYAGELDASGVYLVDRREFAGYWEYLLEDALFTSPPHRQYGGAALIDQQGQLVGIGSLFVGDAGRRGGQNAPGNMFVPIDGLKPIMGDLLSNGRRADPGRPWLGLTLEEHRGRVFVMRVAPDGPGEAAGIQINDMILGVDGVEVESLSDLYRKTWSRGEAGVAVPLDVLQGIEVKPVTVDSADRYRYLRLDQSY